MVSVISSTKKTLKLCASTPNRMPFSSLKRRRALPQVSFKDGNAPIRCRVVQASSLASPALQQSPLAMQRRCTRQRLAAGKLNWSRTIQQHADAQDSAHHQPLPTPYACSRQENRRRPALQRVRTAILCVRGVHDSSLRQGRLLHFIRSGFWGQR